jgi:CRP/FNR family transcriptional regulator, cyclic AMP receptor protein
MIEEDFLRIFFDDFPTTTYRKGSLILSSDEEPEGMYYLQKGFVRQYAKKADGSVLYLHIYRPGSCFPLMWLFNDTKNRYNYEAMTEVVIRKASNAKVKAFIGIHPEIMEHFLSRILLGLDGILARMESLVLDSAYTKTILLFWYFAKTFGVKTGNSIKISVPMSHREIALWIGTARETASVVTEQLKRKGIISYRGKQYEIRDMSALDREVTRIK